MREPPAGATEMGSAAVDSSQWLSVKEETIFLHDGLIRVTDLAELPSEIGASEPGDAEQEILTFETKNPTELAERLRAICGNQSNAYARLLEYRLNALRGLWNAQRQLALEEQQERENSGDEETLALLKRQGLLQQPEQAPFTSRMGLLLIFPLIQSQSRTDPSLCNITAEVLLSCLRDCQPLSLTKEPTDCLNGLESLLCSWLEDPNRSGLQIPLKHKENSAAALVALACARGSLKTLIHTVHLLQKQTDLGYLPVADVLYRLLLLEGGPGSPSCLLGGKHVVSWGFEDMLSTPDNSSSGSESKDADLGRCLATDGLYLYTTNSYGKGISKLGSGLQGTLRGFVYCRNEELEAGWIAFSNCRLLHRPASFDNKPHYLFQIIDQFTLQVCQIVPMPANHFPVGSTMTTIHLCSDGTYVYWIWSPAGLNEKTPKGHSVFMDIFELLAQNGVTAANPLHERIILMKKEGESSKCLNELLLSRMSRFRASHSATLAALTGSTITNTLKEDQSAVNTSCGLPLKTLRRTPMYTCGTYLVMLVSPPGGSGSSGTRSLFGGTSGLSSLKILASSLVFNISDGQFASRADLIDAPGSSLGRGALVTGLGACYDAMNNLIWTCSNDYMDQWCNPGNQAFHHVCKRLGVSHVITEPKEEMVPTSEVINQLLHHVGAMCIHQLNILAASSNLPISTFLGKQHPIESQHFSSICDIMEKAMVNGDTCIIRCILVVFQVVFKFFFNPQTERNREIVRRAGLLLWQLLMAPLDQIGDEIQKEVCLAISAGLNSLYPGEAELNNLLKLVLTEGERNSGLSRLRDVILTNLADQLQNNRFGSEDDEHYRLNDELLHYILKTVVRESCILITKCQTVAKDDFQKLLSTVPVASPSLQYLMAVQNHLLSNTVLIKPDEHDDSDSSLQGETLKVQVSGSSFLSAAQTRWRRGNTRRQALVHMRELLTAAVRVGGVTHLVGPVTMVLQGGPRIEELTCGGMVEQVQEAFGETMTSVVSLCSRYPIACANSIGLLCTIPYTRSEEKCLVRSGLVQLMDRLCSLSGQRECGSNEKQTKKQRVATMAWAAFQVLANRCVEWEKVEGCSTDAVHSGLARQVSSLLTNHLARATDCCGNQAAGNDALQDVLSLLNDLSRSQIGKAILSQPACVSKLLSLLLDQRPSPKLVLIILQLCRAALPLMSVEDCGNVELPPWSYSIQTLDSDHDDPGDPASKIASLLLAKLADYVVPGCQTVLSPSASEPDTSLTRASPKNSLKMDKDLGEEGEAVDGKLSIFIHKREDQSSHEVLQPLLSSSEGRPFRLGTGANMEKVVKMDRDMTKTGCCEVITEEAASALRKATKWAQSGLIVSVGPPVEIVSQEAASGLSVGDKKKTAQTAICRERNTELARSDPVRPFISGHVANSMAAEVIALLHSLLTAPESNTALIWTSTAEKVLSRALMFIPQLGKYAESILENGSSSGRKLAKLQAIARQAVAALCALGGFKETIKIGSEVQVLGKGVLGSVGVVMSINEQEGIAIVKFPCSDYRKTCKASDVLTVPVSRLCTPRSEALPLYKLSITEKVVQAVQSMLLPQEGSLSIHTSLPATGDGSSPVMAVVRLLAEIRTRACLVMAQLLEDSSFCEEFIQQCPAAVEVLNLVAQECSPGERLAVVEAQCERLRMLYRDCARPPPPPLQTDRRQPKEITWCPSRVFPPVRACMFSSHLTSVTFLADPSAGGGLPRGTFIYATSPVPVQAPSFYWEIEIVSYGDTDDDSGPIVSFGFATEAEKRDGAWTNPVGTCLFHNNGRAVHYNGSSLLQWKSVRLDVALVPGDVAGIGWERAEGTPPPPGQPSKGRVYFTYCGQRLTPFLEDVSGGMWPLVHIQKKNTKVRANFGCRPFAYAEGQAHRNAADLCIDLSEEISANFEALPFAMASDSDNDAGASVASDPGSHGPPCRIAAVATIQQQYDSDSSCHYKVELSYENLIMSGPNLHPPPIADDESDDDDDDDIPREDHYALLVKAWETKVFPTIRRRFRNEAERKSGLDQIKGALQLGMVDIARQTVEFLYEENGGIPRDLYLPTIEDIKDEANKFTIDKVRKGLTVVVRSPESNNTSSNTGGTSLPKFATRGMMKTFSLHGIVLDVDSMNELVQVETYLRSEGVLVRYWYPIDMLERPQAGSRRTAANGLVTLDSTNIQIHRELLRCEASLARLYCRMALLNIFAPKSPHTFTRLFHIPAIRDITLEHLQLLSNQLLAPSLADGTISSSSILLAQSIQHCIQGQNCSPTDLFYQGNAQPIREWLTVAITRALHQGEESLLDLTKQICSFLQNAPEQFPSEEFPVTESKINMDVSFPGAAFVIVSCKESQSGFRKE
ncbi:probable E3 ubiquitin-protein ligase HECTD4 [Polypterus senegalus]|uniref:probable E3 ubiquitin-protein ligase HECTD4 n=1 Tax=Polypterus senegalus TaxID=55291 RepID=UPI001965F273|nr:probable E3 ubiquitin-protein ligase HECTD4 [Polypterus senegalus]